MPIAVLGQATGQASLPFFARLFNEKRLQEFATTVNDSVYRVSAASFLATGWMMAAAFPLIDLVYRRGRFLVSDTQTTTVYFFWFSLSLALWSAQGLYARAFYAAGDTLTPMVAVTVITGASLPVYSLLFHRYGVVGLAFASDIGIGANLLALALLLHYRKLVSLRTLRWGELGKSALTAVVAGVVSLEVARSVTPVHFRPRQPCRRRAAVRIDFGHMGRSDGGGLVAAAFATADRLATPQSGSVSRSR